MKVKVIVPFRDKVTGKVYNTKDEIEVAEKRYAEIKRYVVKVADKKEEAKPDKK